MTLDNSSSVSNGTITVDPRESGYRKKNVLVQQDSNEENETVVLSPSKLPRWNNATQRVDLQSSGLSDDIFENSQLRLDLDLAVESTSTPDATTTSQYTTVVGGSSPGADTPRTYTMEPEVMVFGGSGLDVMDRANNNSMKYRDGSFGWIGMMSSCLKPVWGLFGRRAVTRTDDWEIKFEELRDLQWLGSGAQGVVFHGHYAGQEVAIKKVRSAGEIEVRHLRRINHPNIIRFYGVCSQPKFYSIIMEYCRYGTLFEVMRDQQTLPIDVILLWAKQVSHGMAYLHQFKIVHRDLKSPNVLIYDKDTVKISDFNTSRQWDAGEPEMSTTNGQSPNSGRRDCPQSFVGTVAWMAPELLRSESYTEKVDVWSFGVVVWELVTNEMPYRDVDSGAIIWGVGSNKLRLPVPESLPNGLRYLLTLCWKDQWRHRPSFQHVNRILDVVSEELANFSAHDFSAEQQKWRDEISEKLKTLKNVRHGPSNTEQQLIRKRQLELEHAREIREQYQLQLEKTNQLHMQLSAMILEVERSSKRRQHSSPSHNGTLRAKKSSSSTSNESPQSSCYTIERTTSGSGSKKHRSPRNADGPDVSSGQSRRPKHLQLNSGLIVQTGKAGTPTPSGKTRRVSMLQSPSKVAVLTPSRRATMYGVYPSDRLEHGSIKGKQWSVSLQNLPERSKGQKLCAQFKRRSQNVKNQLHHLLSSKELLRNVSQSLGALQAGPTTNWTSRRPSTCEPPPLAKGGSASLPRPTAVAIKPANLAPMGLAHTLPATTPSTPGLAVRDCQPPPYPPPPYPGKSQRLSSDISEISSQRSSRMSADVESSCPNSRPTSQVEPNDRVWSPPPAVLSSALNFCKYDLVVDPVPDPCVSPSTALSQQLENHYRALERRSDSQCSTEGHDADESDVDPQMPAKKAAGSMGTSMSVDKLSMVDEDGEQDDVLSVSSEQTNSDVEIDELNHPRLMSSYTTEKLQDELVEGLRHIQDDISDEEHKVEHLTVRVRRNTSHISSERTEPPTTTDESELDESAHHKQRLAARPTLALGLDLSAGSPRHGPSPDALSPDDLFVPSPLTVRQQTM